MNYIEEINNILEKVDQEHILMFFYSLLRVATSDPDCESVIETILGLFGTD